MRYSGIVAIVALAFTLTAPGCSRVIDEGLEKGLGPTAKVEQLPPHWPEKDPMLLASYKNFELVEPIKNEFPDTPGEFLLYFPTKLAEQMAGKDLPTGNKNAKTCQIKVTILGYQPVTSYEKALGPTEEVIARVELVDKGTQKVIGSAICIGRTYQSVGLGPKWKAWGLARAIVNKWIDPCYPKEGRREIEERTEPGVQ